MQDHLGAAGILAAWEAGAPRRPLDRSLVLLWAAGAGEVEDPADWPIVERDRRLLQIRAATFGPILQALANCRECGVELEMELEVSHLSEALAEAAREVVGLRPLTSRDLAAVVGMPPEAVLPALRNRLAGPEVDGEEAGALDRKIEQAARASELQTELTCPECGARWTETLDVGAHLWSDVEAAALGLLDEVAELARAYGWSEPEILALGPVRRRAYLERVSTP